VTVESFDRSMAVNARGTMLCYEHAGKQMIAQGRGRRIIGAHHPISFNFHIDPWLHQGQVRYRENRVISSSLCVVTGRSSRSNTNTTSNVSRRRLARPFTELDASLSLVDTGDVYSPGVWQARDHRECVSSPSNGHFHEPVLSPA
ncbi:hypothetical protein EDB84DRAFT_1277203, partial [Lactarius hengduanensis]